MNTLLNDSKAQLTRIHHPEVLLSDEVIIKSLTCSRIFSSYRASQAEFLLPVHLRVRAWPLPLRALT